jgi:hypothetical protein
MLILVLGRDYKLGTMSVVCQGEMEMVRVLPSLMYTTKESYPRTSDKHNLFAYLPVCSESSSYISKILFIHLPKLSSGLSLSGDRNRPA